MAMPRGGKGGSKAGKAVKKTGKKPMRAPGKGGKK